MKQNKDKQIRELKVDFNNLLAFLMVCVLIFSIYGVYEINTKKNLKQELQSCQDKVPEIDKMQKVCCYYFDKIEVCWNTEVYFDSEIPERCEVIK